MDRFVADGVELEFQVRGNGEPLLLIHGGMIADSFEPIAADLAVSFTLITYRRRGYCGTPAHRDCTMAMVAADAIALLDHLGISIAHVGGHSYGGCTAMQLAIDAPERVHSLSLLEACVMTVPAATEVGKGLKPIARIFESGDARGALVAFLTAVGGPDPVSRLNRTLPDGWLEQAASDLASVTFAADLPSLGGWKFGSEEASHVAQPTMTLLGSKSAAWYSESHELLNEWFPNPEPFVLEGATHMLHWEDPRGVAKALLAFLKKHPMNG